MTEEQKYSEVSALIFEFLKNLEPFIRPDADNIDFGGVIKSERVREYLAVLWQGLFDFGYTVEEYDLESEMEKVPLDIEDFDRETGDLAECFIDGLQKYLNNKVATN